MSRIYFVTPDREVELHGSERAYMNIWGRDMAVATLRLERYRDEDRDWLNSVVVGKTFDRGEYWLSDFEAWFTSGGMFSERAGLRVGETTIPPGEMALNTLIATGSPPFALMAHLHGTCEDHAWVSSEDAGWLAEIIEAGRTENVLRPNQGWEAVAELAREVESGLPGPIVTSYSVTEGFPNRYALGEPWFYPWAEGQEENPADEQAEGRWEVLPDAEKWDLAVEGIQAREYNRQIAPSTINRGFLSGHSAFDLAAERWQARIA